MIPKTQSDIKNGFEFVTQPDLTFRLDPESMTIWDKISGINALRQAVYLALNIERYDWLIYSWNYGVELRDLIGKPTDYCVPEIERRVREALTRDDRITAVDNFEFEVGRGKIDVTFRVTSVFGSFTAGKEVSV